MSKLTELYTSTKCSSLYTYFASVKLEKMYLTPGFFFCAMLKYLLNLVFSDSSQGNMALANKEVFEFLAQGNAGRHIKGTQSWCSQLRTQSDLVLLIMRGNK